MKNPDLSRPHFDVGVTEKSGDEAGTWLSPAADSRSPQDRIGSRLRLIYGNGPAPAIAHEIQKLVEQYEGTIPTAKSGWSERDALLITYCDSLLGDSPPIQVLEEFLKEDAPDVFSFVHLLPFYPTSGDDGFSVKDFRRVREELGGWGDIERLSASHRLVFDAVINHASASSVYMDGYSAGVGEYADFFVSLEPNADTSKVLRTRNLPLLHQFPTIEGLKWLWTTFSHDQVDLNFRNPGVLMEILDVLLGYAQRGASMIRLDAIPYLWKELGTSCAHLPQTHELIKLIRDVFDWVAPHVLLLTETNMPHDENVAYFGNQGDEAQIIYNFTLPPLILLSLISGNGEKLTKWARSLEFAGGRATYLNITATHDGVGMRPSEGILSDSERAELVGLARGHGGDVTGKRNGDGTVSPYELNLAFFDAVNHPETDEPIETQINRFMVSQAIPLALMGIPGVYIHSLIGSRNNYFGVQQTGRARSINRTQLSLKSLRRELADPSNLRAKVFQQYVALLRLRAEQTAFHPDASQEVLDLNSNVFAVRRRNASTGQEIVAIHNLTDERVGISLPGKSRDLIAGDFIRDIVPLGPYQVRWLTNGCRSVGSSIAEA